MNNVIDKQIQGCHFAKNIRGGNILDEYFTAKMQTFPQILDAIFYSSDCSNR